MRITNFFGSAFKTVRGYQCSSASESISVMLICIILINIEEVDHEHRLQPVRRDSQEKYNPVNSGRKPGKEKHESFSSCSKQHKQTANADQPLQGKASAKKRQS